jgi:hypothetical protein
MLCCKMCSCFIRETLADMLIRMETDLNISQTAIQTFLTEMLAMSGRILQYSVDQVKDIIGNYCAFIQ